jgi:hypothetical protein
MDEFLRRLFPGNDGRSQELRASLAGVAARPGRQTVLLLGPSGSGKTVLAKVLALARMLRRIDPGYWSGQLRWTRERLLRLALNPKESGNLNWFREIKLAGLDTLVDSRLFGILDKQATGVGGHVGIFEQAMTGCHGSSAFDPKAKKDRTHAELLAEAKDHIPRVTEGVVLLDEIGDLPEAVQPKPLGVLNGETQYRVGGEGDTRYGFVFRGLTVLATWRDIARCKLRHDLLQRIRTNSVIVPSLSEYSQAARELFINNILEDLNVSAREESEGLVNGLPDGVVARGYLDDLSRRGKARLTPSDIYDLAAMDWSQLGEFRGLHTAVVWSLEGLKPVEVETKFRQAFAAGSRAALGPASDVRLLRDLLGRRVAAGESGTFARAWRALEVAWAERLLPRLRDRDPAVLQVLRAAGLGPEAPGEVRKELENLKRRRDRPAGHEAAGQEEIR